MAAALPQKQHPAAATVTLSVHGAKIARVRQQLVDCLRRTDVILTSLLQKHYLTPNEYQQIKSHPCTHEVVQHLLDVVTEKSEAVFGCFLNALNSTRQEHLYHLLMEDGETSDSSVNRHPTQSLPDL